MENKDPHAQHQDHSSDAPFRKTVEHFLPELVKRALFLGAGMLFMTEESVRRVLGEINLPREAVNYVIKQSEKSKTEFFSIFQRELNRFLSRVDITRLTKEIVDGISVEINAKVTLRTKGDKGDGSEPGVIMEMSKAPRAARKNKVRQE